MFGGGQILGGGGAIKSIQSGIIDIGGTNSNTATISSVSVSNSELYLSGYSSSSVSSALNILCCRLDLTNATTVTASHAANDSTVLNMVYTVKERYPGVLKSVQRGTIDLSGVSSATATITSVNTAKATARHNGYTLNSGSTLSGNFVTRDVLTNATTVTAFISSAPGAATPVGYEVDEEYA